VLNRIRWRWLLSCCLPAFGYIALSFAMGVLVDAVFPPDQIKGTSVTMHLEVENCDAAVKRARDAGATVTLEPWDSFWGARYARIMDPFGHSWSFAHALPAKG